MELTPFGLWEFFKNLGFQKFPTNLDIVISGILDDNIRSYRGVSYVRLKDPHYENSFITLKVPNSLRNYLKEGTLVKLKGVPYLDLKPEYGRGEVVLAVSEILGVEKPKSTIPEELEILKLKNERGFKDVDQLLKNLLRKGKKPKIALVIGSTAIVDKDVFEALGEKVNFYKIEVIRVNLTDPQELSRKLKELDKENYDLIAIVRGGGDGIEIFNNLELLKAVAVVKKPLVVAIGHAINKPLIELIADKSFITPTDFGHWLKTLVEEVEEVKSKQKLIEKYEEQIAELRKLLKELKEENKSYKQKLEELTKEINRLMEEKNQIEKSLLSDTGKNEALKKELELLKREKENLEKEKQQLLREKEHLQKVQTELQQTIENLTKELNTLRNLTHQQKALEEKYKELLKISKEKEEEIKTLLRDISKKQVIAAIGGAIVGALIGGFFALLL